jgi:predicted nucleic acid-binding protein
MFVAALRSRRGAGSKLFSMLKNPKWQNNISPALFLEYEEKSKQFGGQLGYSLADIDLILDVIAAESNCWRISIVRQPLLQDPDDDFTLDLARTADAQYILTYNVRNFVQAASWGIKVLPPGDFLKLLH